jgi:hypothetical protein
MNITTDVVNNISICKAELRQLTENQKEIKQKPLGISTLTIAFILSKPEDNVPLHSFKYASTIYNIE